MFQFFFFGYLFCIDLVRYIASDVKFEILNNFFFSFYVFIKHMEPNIDFDNVLVTKCNDLSIIELFLGSSRIYIYAFIFRIL